MKVVDFPKKKGGKCKGNCQYVYRMAWHEDDEHFGAFVAKNVGKKEPEIITFLSGFEYESEAEAAAWGYIEALHYKNAGGKL